MISRRRLLGAAVGAGAVTLAGCASGGAESAPDSAPNTTPSRAAPTSAGPTPSPSSAVPSASTSPSGSASPSADAGPPRPRITGTVAEDLEVPWGIAFRRDGTALVGERDSARLLSITPAGRVRTLGTVAGVQRPSAGGEGGLLGLALDPDDEDVLYAYTTTAADNRVVRVSLAGDRVGRPRPVLTGIPTSTHHHGGKLLVAPDKTLFVSVGDAEDRATAQSRTALTGKILRITRDGGAADGNPFGNRTWSYGHRNVEGLAFDAAGRLWATEFGDKSTDELNRIVRGGNYGWPDVEGRSDDSRFRSPAATWSPTSSCSPSGLAVTRGTAFVGALRGECLFSVALDGTDAADPVRHFGGEHGRIRTVVVAPDGALWMTTSNTDGRATPGRNDDRILRVAL
ncbi:glucose/arabinose dehydrogenase [Friedmanniella endophytica]|uniref:Glucose/arabinose dehydrogenase n=1 Tax=Microlunatus kandeliicorticis TaxID=1759536 RepID=A0A7W3IRB0_9ACTN|nr:PQQ-dependent sugar dehydrogenase [Microlunatus kandeliicorticis]MBA8793773.1 glucose/arabinose dehydrogenase [Microlunatus kandeliicorticis]